MLTTTQSRQYTNLTRDELIHHALARQEGVLSSNQALTVTTGKRTGRSPKDRFIVKDELTAATIDWGDINQPASPDMFEALWQKAERIIEQQDHFVSELQVGAHPNHNLYVTVITETAWHHLFARNMFIEPDGSAVSTLGHWTVLHAPSLQTDPEIDGTHSDGAVLINLSQRRALFCGMQYAGELKKAMFTVLNFILPERDVLPMHCAANMGEKGDVALFFGLSGTGKTTLSADPERYLIGDDEHGWGPDGVFNFEGGCYAKCINLSQKNEPLIWHALRHGAIMENVVIDPATKAPDFSDDSYTQNTRASYPLSHIEQRVEANRGGHPRSVLFLTCDLYGVLPPVALLTKEQAAYYFLNGYTALVGSTEVGSGSAIKSTFSACFGAPFFPRPPQTYAELLMKRIEETNAQVYLINTGWTGGPYGQGQRFPIPVTRAVVKAALSGSLPEQNMTIMPGFNFKIPTSVPGVEPHLLDPRGAWQETEDFNTHRATLIHQFHENFKKFEGLKSIQDAGPELIG